MGRILKILFVEDSILDAELIWREIKKNEIVFKKLLVDNQQEFLGGLKSFKPDIIVSDYSLPVFDGMKALLLRNELVPQTPFILVTGSINEEVAVECMKAGADDYILKGNLSRLGPAIINSINKLTLLKQNKDAETALRESEEKFRTFYNDAVVGLYRTNMHGKILMANRVLVKMLGFQSFEELAVRNLNESGYMTSFDRKRFIDQIEKEGEVKEHEATWICRDGSEIIVRESAKAIPDAKGKIMYYDGIVEDITDWKKAEKERQESEKRLRNIFENIQDVYYETSIDGIILEVSPSIAIFSKGRYHRDDLIGKSMNGFYADPGDEKSILTVLEEHGSIHDFEVTLGNNEDININCSISAKIIFNELGRPEKIIGSMRDITERATFEERIQRERIMLRTLIDNIPSMIYVKDIDCRKVIANVADVKNIGYDREEEILGKTDLELFPGETGRRGYADDKKVIGSGEAIIDREEDFVQSDGARRWLVTSKLPLYNRDGKITGLVGIGHDITNRKMIEEALRQSHDFNESLFKTIPFGMDIVNEGGTILFQSDNFKRIFSGKAIGRKCWELYRDDKRQCRDCPLTKGITIGKTEAYESQGVLGGRIFEISHTGMMYQGKKAMLEIFQDITERKENEAELILAKEKAEESDTLKSAFLANMSHEIRTPLNSIIGFSSFLSESNLTNEKRESFIQIIDSSCEQLLTIINDILDISAIEANQINLSEDIFSLDSMMDELYLTYKNQAEEKGLKLIYSKPEKNKFIQLITDERRLKQVLGNLLNNALKFTHMGEIELGYNLNKSHLVIFVRDTGIGVAIESQSLIFDRFSQADPSATRKYGGNGLGLSIAKALVEKMGSKITLKSEEGKGSVFSVHLPVEIITNNQIRPKKQKAKQDLQVKAEGTILIAEDEVNNFLLLKELLSENKKTVLHAWNGKEAVDMVMANSAINLVLMDIKMPIMDGYKAMQLIKDKKPNLPVIAVSAYGLTDDKEKALRAGFDNYISKPINLDTLLKILVEYPK